MRGGRNAGVTIPGQIRWVAMFERWLCMHCEGLCGNPMLTSAAPHQLRAVTLDSLYSSDLACKQNQSISMRVGLQARRMENVMWYPVLTATITKMGLSVVLPNSESSSVWTDSDGMISIKVYGLAARRSKVKLKAWWNHAFLLRRGRKLYLELAKPFVDSLQNDVEKDSQFPADFKLIVEFEDLAYRAAEDNDGQESSACGDRRNDEAESI